MLIPGGQNLDVFSRILAISSGDFPTELVAPPVKGAAQRTEFYLASGILEPGNYRLAINAAGMWQAP